MKNKEEPKIKPKQIDKVLLMRADRRLKHLAESILQKVMLHPTKSSVYSEKYTKLVEAPEDNEFLDFHKER